MKKLLIGLGVIGMLMIIVSLVVAVKFTLNPPPFEGLPFEVTLSEAEAGAEMERLAGLTDADSGRSLGALADVAAGCIKGTLAKPPEAAVVQALRRYMVAALAMKNQVESPLIDPRTRDIFIDGPYSVELLELHWKNKGNSKATIDRWGWFMKHYQSVGHPIYAGVKIAPGDWAAADLDSLFLSMKLNRSTFRPCYGKGL